MSHAMLKKLAGGDRRSIGRSNQVVREVLARPTAVRILVEGLTHADPIVRMRAADALEKVTAQRPDLLRPYKRAVFQVAAASEQQEVRWHMAALFARMNLRPLERAAAADILLDYLRDKSSIVKTFAMQGLGDLAKRDAAFKRKVLPLLQELTSSGTPAMRARGRKLLAGLAQ